MSGSWRFMRALTAGPPGKPFLDQLRLVQTPWFGVFLHVIYRPDEPDPHDHPGPFASFVLAGSYREYVWPDKRDPLRAHSRDRRRLSWARTPRRAAHRVTSVSGPVWTLVLTGPWNSDWGFYVNGGFVPWKKYQQVE